MGVWFLQREKRKTLGSVYCWKARCHLPLSTFAHLLLSDHSFSPLLVPSSSADFFLPSFKTLAILGRRNLSTVSFLQKVSVARRPFSGQACPMFATLVSVGFYSVNFFWLCTLKLLSSHQDRDKSRYPKLFQRVGFIWNWSYCLIIFLLFYWFCSVDMVSIVWCHNFKECWSATLGRSWCCTKSVMCAKCMETSGFCPSVHLQQVSPMMQHAGPCTKNSSVSCSYLQYKCSVNQAFKLSS